MSFSMPYSSRKVYDAELLQLDTMLARMGHAAGGAIESAMTALRTGDVELARGVIARDNEIDAAGVTRVVVLVERKGEESVPVIVISNGCVDAQPFFSKCYFLNSFVFLSWIHRAGNVAQKHDYF